MTDMEIPQAAVEAVYEARGAHRDASECSGRRCSCGQGFPTAVKQLEHETRALLAAAIPHLQADTKAMCETATKVGLELGRKEAAEIAAAFEPTLYASDDGTEFEHTHPEHEGEPECPACWVQHIRQILGIGLPPKSERPLHVMSCDDCRADLDVRDHYPDCTVSS